MQEFLYMVKVGFGTFKSNPPFREYYLDLDTGSTLTWMQCEGCSKCFDQTPNPFPKNNSTSFHLVLDENKKPCPYSITYGDGTKTSGVVARETIHLNSNINTKKMVRDFVFGCGMVNSLDYGEHKNNRVAGIMGLGWGKNSFVNQIKESKGIFSYCLPIFNLFTKSSPRTYLRFGDDISQITRNASTTKISKVNGNGAYYINMQGISIDKKRLNISKDVFALKFDARINGYRGGCIIDSGTPYSRIVGPAYEKLIQGLESYFSKDKNLKRVKTGNGLDLCYVRGKAEGFRNLPEVTFHLQGSKLGFVVRPEGVFEVAKKPSNKSIEYFCLAMMRSKTQRSTLGAQQQMNQRIVYDTWKKKLVFHPEDCSKNP
ncbi:hypothetical protein ABFX02_02G053100 [Erythranthe guttata]